LFARVADSADVLLLAGDLTDYGLPEEARVLAKELATLRIPVVAVLGNHDCESGQSGDVRQVIADAGAIVLDGDATEILGVGIAGVKGFGGGFGKRALGPWGEPTIKQFVREAVDEALKLEAALGGCGRRTWSRCCTTLPSSRRSRASRSKSIPFSGRVASRNRSAAIRCLSSCTAMRIEASWKGAPRTASRSTTCRCRC
jgi:hypothetical protein